MRKRVWVRDQIILMRNRKQEADHQNQEKWGKLLRLLSWRWMRYAVMGVWVVSMVINVQGHEALFPAENSIKSWVLDLIWSMFMQLLWVWNCAHRKFKIMADYSTHFLAAWWEGHLHRGWGEMSRRAKRKGYRSPAPVVYGKVNRKLSQKVSVRAQKDAAAAELQATAWWLHRRIKRGDVERG